MSDAEQEKQEYKEIRENRVHRPTSLPKNMANAFLVGGLICVLGSDLSLNWGKSMGLDDKMSGSFTSVLLILLSVLLTGLNIWPYIGKFGGAESSRAHHRPCQQRSRPGGGVSD